MASIIKGYSYDIFMSYRQKDNKGERWVSEFVEALRSEIEATFKEDINIYFDENPHDGLLETHDVAESLKEKLRCLVFIPIISRTYCDPNSYAWEHEFVAFVEQASNDRFGLKMKLPGGNVASRVLPVRIHDLEPDDIKLAEQYLGFIRPIDFIYKSAGVNRPLRAIEDNPHDNLNHTIYRDQINKVALSLKDIIAGIKAIDSATHIRDFEQPEKTPINIEEEHSNQETEGKAEPHKKNGWLKKDLFEKPKVLFAGILIVLAIIATSFALLHHSKVVWAKEKAMPEISDLVNKELMTEAFTLSNQAAKYLGDDPDFKRVVSAAVKRLTILSEPTDVKISAREYSDTTGIWTELGLTPINGIRMPNSSFYLMKFEKEGYEEVLAVVHTSIDTVYRILFPKGTIPADMVYIPEFHDWEKEIHYKDKNHGYFLDRFEVSNKEYKTFVEKGGYSNPDYWTEEFIANGKVVPRNDAMKAFIDKTGRPGPSIWEAGDYPDGWDSYPVSGVSWYEAAAYAKYAGKTLPTSDHWFSATGYYSYPFHYNFAAKLIPFSNFNGKGADPVGHNQGINCFGAYDMAGNVREWCYNSAPLGRTIRGGGWDDVTYMYTGESQLPSFDRSPKNGFRCAKYNDPASIPAQAFRQIGVRLARNINHAEVQPEKIFEVYKSQFRYDKIDLNAKIEEKDETPRDWIVEKISYLAAYDQDRVIAYLFLPRNAPPPFQTVIFFPGSSAQTQNNLRRSSYAEWDIDFIIKTGRAVLFPVYIGTYERRQKEEIPPRDSHSYFAWLIKWSQDFSRSIDYLETRSDIDINKICFYGRSWGGITGGIIPAIEDRIKVVVLAKGGFYVFDKPYPEADPINYVTRITQPVLMLNGIYDLIFPLESAVKPFFNLLGTPQKDKLLRIFETDHYLKKSDMITEILAWLDKYLGPVKPLK